MTRRRTSRLVARGAAIACALTLLLIAPPVSASSRDRRPPTTPQNLRVTATGPYSVSLAWDPSTDNSGSFSYRVQSSWGYVETVPQTQTSTTFTTNLAPGNTYSFFVYAVDAAGNRSKNSNTVTATTTRDTVAPAAPELSVTEVGSTHVALAWTLDDDDPHIRYFLFMDGSSVVTGTADTSATRYLLQPETTYTFAVQARDSGGNWSPLSEPLAVTTEPPNPDDTTPPTTPTNLWANHWGDLEMLVTWTQSTDDFDPQRLIRYDVYVNGELSDITVGTSRSTNYGVAGQNTITVIAVDTAGNASEPATTTVTLP